VGKPGRNAVKGSFALREQHGPISASATRKLRRRRPGITRRAPTLLDAAGPAHQRHHTFSKREIGRYSTGPDPGSFVLPTTRRAHPGRGQAVIESRSGRGWASSTRGRVFMKPLDCPFRTAAG